MRKLCMLVIAAVMLTPLSAYATTQWTAVGATGSIVSWNYVSNPPIYIALGSGAGMTYYSNNSGTNPFTVAYNVHSGETQPAWTTLTMGYSGVVSGTSITATLYSVDPATGSRTSICSAASTTSTTLSSCTFSSSSCLLYTSPSPRDS